MCTIIVRHHIDDWCSTIIASNRDEFYDRPASGPKILRSKPTVIGGRDEKEGGTWFGLTPSGLFVGLTNQRSFGLRDDTLRSRGELVVDALSTGSLEAVMDFLRALDPRLYNEFNLIFGDGQQLLAAYGRNEARTVELEALGKGVHVLCNDRIGSAEFPKADVARARVESIRATSWPEVRSALIDVLCDRALPDPRTVPPPPPGAPFDEEVARHLQAICVVTPVYGTVSSSLAAVSPGRVERYEFSPRAPHAESYRDVSELTRVAE